MMLENGMWYIDDRPWVYLSEEEIQEKIDAISPEERKRRKARFAPFAKKLGISLPDLDEQPLNRTNSTTDVEV